MAYIRVIVGGRASRPTTRKEFVAFLSCVCLLVVVGRGRPTSYLRAFPSGFGAVGNANIRQAGGQCAMFQLQDTRPPAEACPPKQQEGVSKWTRPLVVGYECVVSSVYARPRPWQFLNFLPLPQGQGSLRPGSLLAIYGMRLASAFSRVSWCAAACCAGSSRFTFCSL